MASALRPFRHPGCWLGLWIFGLAATLAICVVPLPAAAPTLPHLDKVEHALGFALLASYAVLLFANPRARRAAAFGLIGFGIAIEAVQAWLPWRSADPLDMLADALGVLIGSRLAATPAATWLLRLDAAWSRRGR
jgi:VanZ family protein